MLNIVTFESHRFTLQEFGFEGCINLCEVEGLFKLMPVTMLEESDLKHMTWLREYQDLKVCLVGDAELTKGRSSCVQMLYEFNIMSTSLPNIKNSNMMTHTDYMYTSQSTLLSFKVPACPEHRRLEGLIITFQYTAHCEDWVWFAKISTSSDVNLMYNPRVFGKPNEVGMWLSYWPIGKALHIEETVHVSIVVIKGLYIHWCGASLVYTDEGANEALQENKECATILGEDFSEFQLSTGAYYLCRRDFFELMEAGKLTSDWFRILVDDKINYTEVGGWRMTGKPEHPYQSYTEVKTIRCIMYGPEMEESYKIADLLKSSHVDKTIESRFEHSRAIPTLIQYYTESSESHFGSFSLQEDISSGLESSLYEYMIESDLSKAIPMEEIYKIPELSKSSVVDNTMESTAIPMDMDFNETMASMESTSKLSKAIPMDMDINETMASMESTSKLSKAIPTDTIKELETIIGIDQEFSSSNYWGDGGGVGYDTYNIIPADEECSIMEEIIARGDLKAALFACAKAVAQNNTPIAEKLISMLHPYVSVSGDPSQRLAAYMLEAINARLYASGTYIYRALNCKEPIGGVYFSYTMLLYEACPCFKLGYLSANGAIVEATKNEDSIHIIDFQISQGGQWVTLIQALAARPGGPPKLRITGIDDARNPSVRGGGLDIVGQRLATLAESFKVPFEFYGVPVSVSDIEIQHLTVQPGEALAVNCALVLHHLPDETVHPQNQRDRLIKLIKSLSPKVVTLVEQESDVNTTNFFQRFQETFSYYSAMFDSIDATLPRDHKERINVEQHCLAAEIVNVLACEGTEREERHELLRMWRSRFAKAGFTPYPLSAYVNATIKNLLKDYSDKYRFEERDGALLLGWMNRDLVSSCAWK